MYTEYPQLGELIQALDLGEYLEFGCGGGMFLRYVLDQNQSSTSITAVDINPQAIEQAKSELENHNIKFIVQEELPLNFEDHRFATITLSNTLHHLKDKGAVLAELKRLIHPEGKIIITEMVSNSLSSAESAYCRFHALRAEIDTLNGLFHDRTYTETEIKQIVKSVGFKIDFQTIVENDKTAGVDRDEIHSIEIIIDEMVEEQREKTEYHELVQTGESIKSMLNKYGIKRPRQLYLETSV